MENNPFDYIKTEEKSWRTVRIPLTTAKDWNMSEHIERCYNVANGWFHSGKNDGLRPYDDIVTPIVDVAFRSRGFDVKDIVPFVEQAKNHYKSFIVKKYHQKWAMENHLDTLIDEVVESSIVYDLVLIKNTDKPQVIPLQTIAFCDQKDVLSAPLCLKHQYSISELRDMAGKWEADKIELAIAHAENNRKASMANDQESKTPGRYIEVYELHGRLPEYWVNPTAKPELYMDQMHIICFYKDKDGNKQGITLYKGKSKPLKEVFDALKIDTVRSKGRACGRSVVERLFEPQVWNNYSGIRIKEMLDTAALTLAQSASQEIGNQKLNNVKGLTILKHEDNKPLSRVDTYTGQNMGEFMNYRAGLEKSARMLGSASESALGVNPTSGTPFSTTEAILQQGEGIHEYARGKVATFFADVLYPKHFLKQIVADINSEKEFSSEFSLEEMIEISETIAENQAEEKINDMIFREGKAPTEEEREALKQTFKEQFKKKGRNRFIKTLKDEMKDIPLKVRVNVAGKQKYLAQNADKLSRLITNILANPQAFAMIPGLGSAYNQLIESSGMNPIDFSSIISDVQSSPDVKTKKVDSPIGKEELQEELK